LAGQRVIHRWLGCGQPGYKPRSASTVAESHPVVHGCPPVVHRISTGFVPRPGDNAETLPTRRPQNLQQEIHTPPQGVGTEVTLRTCPHRFAQGLSTSVVDGGMRCPPLGITSWGRPVDNLGTRRCGRRVCGCTADPRGPDLGRRPEEIGARVRACRLAAARRTAFSPALAVAFSPARLPWYGLDRLRPGPDDSRSDGCGCPAPEPVPEEVEAFDLDPASGALFDAVGELGDLVVERPAFRHVLPDLAVRVHHGGVVTAAEGLADPGQ
jgi:hypothetical protein